MSSASSSNPSAVPSSRAAHPWRRAWVLAGIFALAFIVLSIATAALHHPAVHDTKGWLTNYDAALSRTAAERKPVFIDFYFVGCPPCDAMSREVFPEPAVSRMLQEQFVPLKADVLDGGAGAELARKYWIEATPTLIVLDSAGNLIARHTSYMDVDEFTAFLRSAKAKIPASPAASHHPDTLPAP